MVMILMVVMKVLNSKQRAQREARRGKYHEGSVGHVGPPLTYDRDCRFNKRMQETNASAILIPETAIPKLHPHKNFNVIIKDVTKKKGKKIARHLGSLAVQGRFLQLYHRGNFHGVHVKV